VVDKVSNWTGFSQSTSVFPCQYHSTYAPYTYAIHLTSSKGKLHSRTDQEGQEGQYFLYLGARLGWVVNATPRPLYPQ